MNTPLAAQPLPWNPREQQILLGNIELFAALLARCYNEMTPVTKDCALELGKTLGRLKRSLQAPKPPPLYQERKTYQKIARLAESLL